MERNFETVMIEQCSPVLAGLKAAGLFRYETQDCKDLAERVRGWNARLGEKGLRVRVLKGCTRAPTGIWSISTGRTACAKCFRMRMSVHFWCRKATVCPKGRTTANRCCGSCRGGCAARQSFRMRSAYFWATPSPMWWALSKMRAATSPAAAAGKPTETLLLPGSILPS